MVNKLMSMFSGGRLRMERPSNSSSTSEGFAPCTPPSLEDFSQGKARERDRIATVHALGALNTPGEERFDSITKLMTSIFKTPVSVVTILGDTDAWSKSCAGPFGNVSVPRTETVCNSVIVPSVPEVLVVEDMSKDARFFRIPFVEGPPYLRFYAGAPLLGSNGHRYGTLCILDYEPRSFPPQLLNTLINFAELATRELERGCVNARPPSAVPVKRLRSRAVENQAVALLDMQSSKWKVLWVNEPWAADVGRLPDTGCAGSVAFWDLFELDDSGAKAALSAIQPALQTQQPVRLCVRRRGNGFAARLSVVFRPATDALAPDIPVVIPAVAADLGSSGSAAQAFGTSAVSPWFAILEEAPSTPTVAQQPQSPMQMSEEMAPPPAEFDAAKLLHGVGLPPCLNGLQIGPLLGVGSYGRVHYGLWQGTLVAVKIVDVPADASPEVRSLLANSMLQCKATMCHPNVVRTISAVFDEQKVGSAVCPEGCARLWFLLEYCDKGRLLDAVERGWLVCRNETADGHAQAEPDMQSILLTARDIAAGLVHLHSMGAVHGDLTGANILLASSGADSRGWVAKLSDVGLPGLDQLSSTSTTNHCGTVAYMSPELLSDGVWSPALDMYSFGVCLWEMYTSSRAWAGHHPAHVMLAVTSGRVPTLPGSTPPIFKDIVNSCLRFEPSRRPSASSVLDVLNSMLYSK